MPLSEKSKTTLRLMGESEGSESFSTDDVQRCEPESPNAHLPFVLDVTVRNLKPIKLWPQQLTIQLQMQAMCRIPMP